MLGLALGRDLKEMVMTDSLLSVAMVPEGLPAVMTQDGRRALTASYRDRSNKPTRNSRNRACASSHSPTVLLMTTRLPKPK